MHIEKINENKIKVTVNKEDIKIWNVNMKNLTDNTPEAQDLFWFALRQAEKDVDFRVGESQLLVEALPSNAEGFVMLISKMDPGANVLDAIEKGPYRRRAMDIKVKKRNRSAALTNIFKFEDFEDLCKCAEQIKDLFGGKSALYKYKEQFYLILIPYDTMMFFEAENVIMEYASRVSSPALYEGVLKEHGQLMIKENAFETIMAYFN